MSAAAKPRVDLDATRERLLCLGLAHAAESLAERVTAAVKNTVSPHRFVDDLLDAELGACEERRVRTSLRLSGLPIGQTLTNFDFIFQPSVDRSRIETLATCAWIREAYTLLLQGPPARLRRRKYNNVALVIIDEVGFEPMSREDLDDLEPRNSMCRLTPGTGSTGPMPAPRGN